MSDSRIIETDQIELKKYKELYDLSKEVFYDELGRSTRIDEKASKYLTVLTLLLGAFAFFGKRLLDSILPPKNPIEWLLVIVSGLLLVFLVITWFLIFKVFKGHEFKKIPIDINFFDEHELIDIYYALSRGIKEALNLNRQQGDSKNRNLSRSFVLIRIIVVLLAIILILFTVHIWSEPKKNNKQERSAQMAEEPKKPVQQQQEPVKPPKKKPDPDVKPPEFDRVTEDLDLSKVQKRSGSQKKEE